jgi:hypothetical protein
MFGRICRIGLAANERLNVCIVYFEAGPVALLHQSEKIKGGRPKAKPKNPSGLCPLGFLVLDPWVLRFWIFGF